MPRFVKLGGPAGFDDSRNLQVLSIGMKTEFSLVDEDGENDIEAWPDDEDILEAKTVLGSRTARHKVSLRGKSTGTTKLHFVRRGLVLASPTLIVSVVPDPNARQVGKASGEAGAAMRRELQRLSLRQAVLRVAEDQLHSAICTKSDGFGTYSSDAGQNSYDWCGLFAYYCWRQAAAIKGVGNPFGESNEVLASVQKAIHWAMRSETPGQLLRYEGASPIDGKGDQDYVEIGWNNNYLEPGDIVLQRAGNARGWKHVCMVYSKGITTMDTIDGNQGAGQCIKIRKGIDIDERLPDRSFARVFIHVRV
jgi:hypothetical protein